MEKKKCSKCGKEYTFNPAVAVACPFCSSKLKGVESQVPDTESYNYLSHRDYSVPENYPGY